ncbi:MAG TPA: chemotaxis protein CheW [Nitrospirota bacterium]
MNTEMMNGAGEGVSGDTMQVATFLVAGEEYAVDIMRIIEIIRPQKITAVPRAPVFVEGIISLRGKVVPVVDLRHRFGIAEHREDPKKVRIVIVQVGERVVGLIVDEVLEVIDMDRSEVEETPDTVRGVDAEYLEGVGKSGDSLIFILDIGKILTKDEIRQLGSTVLGPAAVQEEGV